MSIFSKEKKQPVELSLYQGIVNYKHGKKKISNFSWLIDIVGGLFIAAMIADKVFGFNEQLSGSGWLAIGGSVALFSILTKNDKASALLGVVSFFFVIIYVVFEMLAVGGSYMAASSGKTLDQIRESKQDSRANIASLQAEINQINNSTTSDNTKAYDKRLIREEIRKEKANANKIIGNNEDKLFSELDSYFGTSHSEAYYKAILSALLILSGVIVIGNRGRYWCNLSLEIEVKSAQKTAQLMYDCKAWKPTEFEQEVKRKKPATVKDKGTGAQSKKQDITIEQGFEFAQEHLKSLTLGEKIDAKQLRKETKQATRAEQNSVIELLDVRKIIEKQLNGNAPNYYHYGHAPEKAKKKESGLQIVN